jgi:hypothetical protein
MKVITLLCALVLVGCGDTIINVPDSSKTATNPTTPTVAPVRIEYRISGNANSVRVRYYNPIDGLVVTTTTLPFSVNFTTNQDSLFLSLDITPISYSTLVTFPFLSGQIFVNGGLFREVTSNEFLLNTISVNGTWRR